jgi:hypothetical protein
MTDFTSTAKVSPTTLGTTSAGRVTVEATTTGASAPAVDRSAVWQFLKDSATRLLREGQGGFNK